MTEPARNSANVPGVGTGACWNASAVGSAKKVVGRHQVHSLPQLFTANGLESRPVEVEPGVRTDRQINVHIKEDCNEAARASRGRRPRQNKVLADEAVVELPGVRVLCYEFIFSAEHGS